jgi:hypothetical protein
MPHFTDYLHVPSSDKVFKTQAQRNRFKRYIGQPIGCYHCRWSGFIPFRNLPLNFTLDQYESAVESMIPCECDYGRKRAQDALQRVKSAEPVSVMAWMMARATQVRGEAQRYNELCKERMVK